MAILETIAAANAAYSIIRQCLQNGKETGDLISNVGKFLSAEEELKEAVQRKKNNLLASITGGSQDDWEEFQHLESLRQKRQELESFVRLYCEPGTWQRWQNWQLEARKQRQAAKRAAEKAHQERMELIGNIAAIVVAVVAVVAGVYFLGVWLERW